VIRSQPQQWRDGQAEAPNMFRQLLELFPRAELHVGTPETELMVSPPFGDDGAGL
jgi:hypothetical protein